MNNRTIVIAVIPLSRARERAGVRVHGALALALALASASIAGCSLLVPGPDGLTPDLGEDAGPDAGDERDAGRDDDGGPTCADGLTLCDGDFCSDTSTDATHCGGCGNVCDPGWTCRASACFDPVVDVSAGITHACASRASGRVVCWGKNEAGQLGTGDFADSSVPRPVLDIDDATGVSSAGLLIGGFNGMNCVTRSSGEVWCWGSNTVSQLGDGSTEPRNRPVRVQSLVGATQVEVGLGHACARKAAQPHVVCWGSLITADGMGSQVETAPLSIFGGPAGSTAVLQIASSTLGDCLVDADHLVWCWGANMFGQVGDGTTQARGFAAQVAGLDDVAEVVTNSLSTCARQTSGQVWCWGRADLLGVGMTTMGPVPTPQAIPSLANATRIFSGAMSSTTCALRTDGSVWCWGVNHAETVRTGSFVTDSVPTEYTDVAGLTEIATSAAFTCGLRSSGDVVCWGSNTYGQLGDGTGMDSSVPVLVALP